MIATYTLFARGSGLLPMSRSQTRLARRPVESGYPVWNYSASHYHSEVRVWLAKMVFLGQVLLFSITGCPFCARTKKMLRDLQVPFVDVNLEKYPERRYEMQERTGRRTVPQIFFNSNHIGGYDDIKKLVRYSLVHRHFSSGVVLVKKGGGEG